MSDFKAKMHQSRFPDPLAVFKEAYFYGEGGERKGKDSRLPPMRNPGYATAPLGSKVYEILSLNTSGRRSKRFFRKQ